MTTKELEKQLDSILFFDTCSEDFRSITFDYQIAELFSNRTSLELFDQLTCLLTELYFHMMKYIQKENYDIASKIRDCIKIEEKNFKVNYKEYSIDYQDDYINTVDMIHHTIRSFYHLD